MAKVEVDILCDDGDFSMINEGTTILETNGISVIPAGGCYSQYYNIAGAGGWSTKQYINGKTADRIMEIQRSEIQNLERIE